MDLRSLLKISSLWAYNPVLPQNEAVIKTATTEQSVAISQLMQDNLWVMPKMEKLERMATVKNDDRSCQMPTLAAQTSKQQITLSPGETLPIAAFNGETYIITRVPSKKQLTPIFAMKINLAKVLITSLITLSFGTAIAQVAQVNDPSISAFDGSYERHNVRGIKKGKSYIVPSAELTIYKDGGTYKMNYSGRCYNKEVPIEVLKKMDKSIVIRVKFSNTYVECEDVDLELNLVVVNGEAGLARANEELIEFKKISSKN